MKTKAYIHVFKTGLRSETDKRRIRPALLALQGIWEWSVDLEDCDAVLRVVTTSPNPHPIIRQLELSGYSCYPLI
ncbi:MAG: hypothetical protein INR69_15780 [Mucilaginibacter polytrichastri]|nr:hypothetical protein [Mucilaginibacter polytrichastri]